MTRYEIYKNSYGIDKNLWTFQIWLARQVYDYFTRYYPVHFGKSPTKDAFGCFAVSEEEDKHFDDWLYWVHVLDQKPVDWWPKKEVVDG